MFKSSRIAAVLLVLAIPGLALAQPLPDPTERTSMQRVATGNAVSTSWVLESTLVSADRRVAVINGNVVTVGDRVDGARVVEIGPFAVRLRTGDGNVVLTLTDNDPKRVDAGGQE